MKQLIALTGATGFVGQSICNQLSAHGYSIRALVRNPRDATLPALRGAEIITGDLANRESLHQLITGADAVIHCAGKVRGATQQQFDRVNVAGTKKLLQALNAGASPPRLLAISSLAAREPQLSFYAASKRRAEQVLQDEGMNIPWTILRPPAIYGPGDREMLPIFRLMARGMALTAGAPSARVSLLYVEDLSAAVIAWLKNAAPGKAIFTLDDGKTNGYDWHEISAIVSELVERKVRVVQAPLWLLDATAWLNSRLAPIFNTSPMLTPQKLCELRHNDWVCDNAAFMRAFDWSPKVRLQDGLRTTPNWPGHRRPDSRAE